MTKEQLQDKCRGSLIGGAIGDAFGFPDEFTKSLQLHDLIVEMADEIIE